MVTPVRRPVTTNKLPPSFLGEQLRWFPFSQLRRGQTKVLRLLEEEKRLALQAPTGFGKSVLTLAGIWYRHIWGERQLYLFAKTKAQLRSVFLRNLKQLFSQPPADQLTILPLIARRDLCSHPNRDSCSKCPAKFQARYLSSQRLEELLSHVTLASCPETLPGFRKRLQRYGCPYDLIRRMLPQVNIILLTHGYLESLSLRELFDRLLTKAEHYSFKTTNREVVIDEAHNFGPTVEALLTREQLERAQELGPFPVVQELLLALEQPLGRIERPRGAMVDSLEHIDSFLQQKRHQRYLSTEDYEILHAVRSFIERKADYWVLNEQGLVQLNPWPARIFKFLRLRFDRIVLLSGTFHKFPLYSYLYGLHEGGVPFTLYRIGTRREQRRQLVFGALYHPAISSKPEHRTPEFYTWCADLIHEMSLLSDDHTLIFVPSYEVLESMYPLLHERLKGHLSTYREPAKGRIPFLETLEHGPPSVVVAVYGGKFSEGVEIRHPTTGRSRIRLVVLVGLPFPPPTPEFFLLQRLYRRRWGDPVTQWALLERILHTQVQQCLGRAIRSEQDRAIAIILDYRAVTRLYLPGMRVFRTRTQLTNTLMLALIRMRKLEKPIN